MHQQLSDAAHQGFTSASVGGASNPLSKELLETPPILTDRPPPNAARPLASHPDRKLGILGLPNVGKSTFFNLLKSLANPAENYPVCSINPNEARVMVADDRFDWLVQYYKPASKMPAFLNVVDIAGLSKGASEGKRLDNAFLSHVSACDALFHLCRAFDDDDVIHVDGKVNPTRDLDIITNELIQRDLQYLESALKKLENLAVEVNDKTTSLEYDTLKKVQMMLTVKKPARLGDWNETEREALDKHLFLTSKPIVYLVNLTEKDFIRNKNKWLPKIKEWIDKNDPQAVHIPFSGVFERKLVDMPDDEREKYLKENNASSNLLKIVHTGYKALKVDSFFTAGADEVRAWTIQERTKAPQAAGRIHTDFEKGFIMAEVFKVADLIELGDETKVKSGGKYRQQGKTYVVEDGDVILFKFNAGAGLNGGK